MDKKNLRKTKKLLYQQALIAHDGKIKPCGKKNNWEQCFTLYKDHLYFWYNTNDDSTHVLDKKIQNEGAIPARKKMKEPRSQSAKTQF
jgi:hypothetical protein